MKINKTILLVALSLTLSVLAEAQEIAFKIGKLYTTSKAGEAVVAEGGVYVVVPVTMKNLTPKKQSVGGIASTSFVFKQGDFSFDVDGGVGWTFGNKGYFDGLAVLEPLMPQTVKVAFTVPAELISGKFTLTLPDGSVVNLNQLSHGTYV